MQGTRARGHAKHEGTQSTWARGHVGTQGTMARRARRARDLADSLFLLSFDTWKRLKRVKDQPSVMFQNA